MITKRGLRKTMARSIVVGTDGSKPAEEAVRQATDLASREGARLHLVAAYPDPQVLRERITGGTRVCTCTGCPTGSIAASTL